MIFTEIRNSSTFSGGGWLTIHHGQFILMASEFAEKMLNPKQGRQ
jgi:hypothetical protein